MNAFERYPVTTGHGNSKKVILHNKVSDQPAFPLVQPLINIVALTEKGRHLPHLVKVMDNFDLEFALYKA